MVSKQCDQLKKIYHIKRNKLKLQKKIVPEV